MREPDPYLMASMAAAGYTAEEIRQVVGEPAARPAPEDVIIGKLIRTLHRQAGIPVSRPAHLDPTFYAKPFCFQVVANMTGGDPPWTMGVHWQPIDAGGLVGNAVLDPLVFLSPQQREPAEFPAGFLGVLNDIEVAVGRGDEADTVSNAARQFRWSLRRNKEALPGFLNQLPSSSTAIVPEQGPAAATATVSPIVSRGRVPSWVSVTQGQTLEFEFRDLSADATVTWTIVARAAGYMVPLRSGDGRQVVAGVDV